MSLDNIAGYAQVKSLTDLDTDGTIHIHQSRIVKLLLYFVNFRVVERPSNQSLQATDSVTEVRGLQCFCGLPKGPLLRAKGNE